VFVATQVPPPAPQHQEVPASATESDKVRRARKIPVSMPPGPAHFNVDHVSLNDHRWPRIELPTTAPGTTTGTHGSPSGGVVAQRERTPALNVEVEVEYQEPSSMRSRVQAAVDEGAGRAALRGQRQALSDREALILDLVATGMSSRQVARRLGLSESLVNTHVKYMMAIADVSSRPALVAWGFRQGLLR
jgi:DNA-binding CsgD family transcriptional regulator